MILRCGGEREPLPALAADALPALQAEVEKTHISEAVARYIAEMIHATRKDMRIMRGASPRATLSVAAVAKAWAQLQGRDYVIPEDAQLVFLRCVPHRILTQGDGTARLRRILRRVPMPKLR